MKYEIINPSDKCYITSDNETVAKYCTLLLGAGMYALKDENGNYVGDMYIFGVDKETLDKEYEGDFDSFPKKHTQEIIDCFNSFEYAGERTSMNNIGERAFAYAKKFKGY